MEHLDHLHNNHQVFYHILPRSDWAAAQAAGKYTPDSLDEEGFIHCSKVHQVLRSANAYFKGQTDLLLLCIASEKIKAEVRYEDSTGSGELFPHI